MIIYTYLIIQMIIVKKCIKCFVEKSTLSTCPLKYSGCIEIFGCLVSILY